MPILAKEPELFPDDLLECTESPLAELPWFVIYTISRREKDLVRRLRKMEIAHYCPLAPHRTKSPQGRVRTSYQPLFSGYVFVRGTQEDRYETIATGCVSKCIAVEEPERLITDLRQIRYLATHGQDLKAELRPVVGQRARIVRGPLKDRELVGTITSVNSQFRLTVMVNFLQQGASITVDEADVELL